MKYLPLLTKIRMTHSNCLHENWMIGRLLLAMSSQLRLFRYFSIFCNMVGIVETFSPTCFQYSQSFNHVLLRTTLSPALHISDTIFSNRHTWKVISCSVWLLYYYFLDHVCSLDRLYFIFYGRHLCSHNIICASVNIFYSPSWAHSFKFKILQSCLLQFHWFCTTFIYGLQCLVVYQYHFFGLLDSICKYNSSTNSLLPLDYAVWFY